MGADWTEEQLWRGGGETNRLDLSLDARFPARARALRHLLARGEAEVGARWTTVYRSEAYTDQIYANKWEEKNGEPWDWSRGRPPRPYSGISLHSRLLSADDGVSYADTPQILKEREEALRASTMGPFIKNVVHEGNHLHLDFWAEKLEDLGRRLLELEQGEA